MDLDGQLVLTEFLNNMGNFLYALLYVGVITIIATVGVIKIMNYLDSKD